MTNVVLPLFLPLENIFSLLDMAYSTYSYAYAFSFYSLAIKIDEDSFKYKTIR